PHGDDDRVRAVGSALVARRAAVLRDLHRPVRRLARAAPAHRRPHARLRRGPPRAELALGAGGHAAAARRPATSEDVDRLMYRFVVRLGFVAIGVAAIVAVTLALVHWSPLVTFLRDHAQPVGPDGWGPDLSRPDQLGHVARTMLPIVA